MAAKDIVLVNGQSNANFGMERAIQNCLAEQTPNWMTARSNLSSSRIKLWVDTDADPDAKLQGWDDMMAVFDAAMQDCFDNGDTINSLTLFYFQGEGDSADVGADLANGLSSYYFDHLKFFMTCFRDHALANWNFCPTFVTALIHIDTECRYGEGWEDEEQTIGMNAVRADIQAVMDCFAEGSTVETNDIPRLPFPDCVHVPNGGGNPSPEQVEIAKRVLTAARSASGVCSA